MKIKYIDGEGWDWLKTYSCDISKVEEPYKGTISLISDTTVRYQLTVDYEDSSKILFDEGYKCVTFIPDEGFWAVMAVYDDKDNIVEWYFDILHSKGFNEEGRIYYNDLYLDVVVRPDFEVVLIDEDDLEEALKTDVIKQNDYDFAYEMAEVVMSKVTKDKKFLVTFLGSHLNREGIGT